MIGDVLVAANVIANLCNIVKVVSKGSMDVAQNKLRISRDYLIRAHGQIFVPDDDVHHADSMARNAGFSALNARTFCDALCYDQLDRMRGRSSECGFRIANLGSGTAQWLLVPDRFRVR